MRSMLTCLLAGLCAAGACGRSAPPGTVDAPTFNEHVGPLLFEHCTSCHRQGQGTPLTFLTYGDATRNAVRIEKAVTTGHIPPCLPEPNTPRFLRTQPQPAGDSSRVSPQAGIGRWAGVLVDLFGRGTFSQLFGRAEAVSNFGHG